jgi:hypothetical protein
MRLNLLVLAAVLVLALLVAGFAVSPYPASALNPPQEETIPAITHATATHNSNTWIDYPSQQSYLTLTVTTDKSVYLSGEVVNITVTTSTYNTHASLTAQLPDGTEQPIENFTFNYTRTITWTAPTTSGQIKLNCEGDALSEVWDYCTRVVCISSDCHIESYPCLRTITITDNADNDIKVFGRTTSISGRIIDTNQLPVPGANISISSTGQSTTSDNDGYYEFSTYELSNNYSLINQIPTVTDTISVVAIACEPQQGTQVQIQAEQVVSDANFTLKRSFYPPDIDLSEFTLAAFSVWPEAQNYATWQDILGITVDGQVQPIKWQYGTKDMTPQLLTFGDKKLYLFSKPAQGRYFLDIQGTPNSQYKVVASATINDSYFQPVTVNSTMESDGSQRLRLILDPDKIQLQVIKPFPILLIIIPIIIGILAGLVAAYFLTGGKMRWAKAFAGRKPPEKTEPVKEKETTKVRPSEKKSATRKTKRRVKRK